jgi:hypothetical protein
VIEVISRAKGQAPPPWVVWESLADPRLPTGRPWLFLVGDEVPPRILRAERPRLVVWSSLWPDRPDDEVRFDLGSDGGAGCVLRWTLLAAREAPGEERRGRMRYRLNTLINNNLRQSFDG